MGNYLYFKQTITEFGLFKEEYSSEITTLLEEQFTKEKVTASGCSYFIIMQYLLGYFLCVQIYKRVTLGEDIEDVQDDLGLSEFRERFLANGIDIDLMYQTLYP